MKCQKCNKPAVFHITENFEDPPVEIHLCEEHANEYLNAQGNPDDPLNQMAAAYVQGNSSQTEPLQDVAAELQELDSQMCPVCGLTFQEFRRTGRFGCPNDYEFFREQIEPLIFNIHGDVSHIGKEPAQAGTQNLRLRTRLIRLRRELDEAVMIENYERASELRDEIESVKEKIRLEDQKSESSK